MVLLKGQLAQDAAQVEDHGGPLEEDVLLRLEDRGTEGVGPSELDRVDLVLFLADWESAFHRRQGTGVFAQVHTLVLKR